MKGVTVIVIVYVESARFDPANVDMDEHANPCVNNYI